MKIVFLDAKTIGSDIDLSPFNKLGEVTLYPFSSPTEIPERVKDADVLILNKTPVNEKTIYTAKNLKLICVTATGTDILDKEYLARRKIAWRNVAGYSTESVAQHTFAMLFYLLENLPYYDQYVKNHHYANDILFTHFASHFHELCALRWGIIGLGTIGRRVADIASSFGADVIYYSTSNAAPQKGYQQVDLDTLLATSDIVSVHAPLNENTRNLMNKKTFKKMQPHAIFLNLGRGPIVNETALVTALNENWIAAAGLDVLTEEPMSESSPFLDFKDSSRLLITPHIAWASIEARTRLMKIIEKQIISFFSTEK